jgi:hypothetical protein
MLTRPGSEPGPERMRKLAGSLEGFRELRKAILGIRALFSVLQVASISVHASSLGIFVLARLANRWCPVRALAFGHATLGAVATGRYACGFGIASEYHEGSGEQKESLFG